MSENGTIFLGVAELGWEYLRWSGYCRKIARQNERSAPYFVCTHDGRDILYSDFCDGYIHHNFWFVLKRDAGVDFGNFHGYGLTKFKDSDFDELGRWAQRVVYQKYGVSCDVIRHPIGIKRKYEYKEQHMATLRPGREAVYIWESLKKQKMGGVEAIVAVFPRRKGDIRDWGEDRYVRLIDMLINANYGVVIGGDPSMSFCTGVCTKNSDNIVNIMNMSRDNLLNVLVAALRDCKLAVGSQSVLPLIALGQGVTTYMWGCEPVRHSKYYNWSGADCYFSETQDYSISPEEVFKKIEDIIPFAENKWPHIERKSWKMLKRGERLPDEKDKAIAKAYNAES